jgi:hypothetical protein
VHAQYGGEGEICIQAHAWRERDGGHEGRESGDDFGAPVGLELSELEVALGE